MDFFTIDTMLGKRFYVFAIISHKTGEIMVRTGVEASNMNSIMERFCDESEKRGDGQFSADWQESGSEELDEYVASHNGQRPHQGLQQQIPKPGEPGKTGGAVRVSMKEPDQCLTDG
jgi:hypothetical protein